MGARSMAEESDGGGRETVGGKERGRPLWLMKERMGGWSRARRMREDAKAQIRSGEPPQTQP